ncbi:ribonuclease Z [Nematocida sp. AWRm79]|nr:ribonuclease Z [Nematocida sp. AWRm79]
MYQIAINSTEGGTALRIINRTTSNYIIIGGFEGMQRYMGRHKIKSSKAQVICICSEYEIVPAISGMLTTAMHEGKRHTKYVSTEKIARRIQEVGMGIGNLEFFGKYDNKSPERIADVRIEERKGLVYTEVTLPNKKASFNVERAAEKGISSKSDLATLNKTGRIVKEGVEYFVDEFRNKEIKYPKIVVITVLSENYSVSVEDIQSFIAGNERVEIFIRGAPEGFRNTQIEHKTIVSVEKEIKCKVVLHNKTAKTITEVVQYILIKSEVEADCVKDFYNKICPVYTPLIRPRVYKLCHTKYLRNSQVLIDQSFINYASHNELTIHNQWKREVFLRDNNIEISRNSSATNNSNLPISKPYTVFLGTAAAVPGVIRNVSSILMTSQNGAILFDCGEDTGTQLNKISIQNKYNYASLNMIILTHRHADHVLGTLSVLNRCNLAGNPAVIVFGHKCLVPALEKYRTSCIFIQNRADLSVQVYKKERTEYICIAGKRERLVIKIQQNIYKHTGTVDPLNYKSACDIKKAILQIKASCNAVSFADFINLPVIVEPNLSCPEALTLKYKLSMCSALHIHESYSFLIKEYADNMAYSLAYSGDTRPNIKFADLSFGADLMVHEGTFEEDEYIQAQHTMHSTIPEALDIFKKSKACELFITHISQRYKTVAVPDEGNLALDYLVHTPGTKTSQKDLHTALLEWAEEKE